MPTQTPGDPNLFPVSVPLYDDGDEQAIETVNIALEGLLDRTASLRSRQTDPLPVPLFGAQQTEYDAVAGGGAAAVVPRFAPWPVSVTEPAPADFGRGGWVQIDKTDGGGLWWWIPIRFDIEIVMVAAAISGDDGPGTNPGFPAAPDRPQLRLYRQATDGSDVEPLLQLGDETGSQPEYEAHHTVPLDPGIDFSPALELSSGEYLIIEFVGHKGGNVGNNTLKLYGITIGSKLP